MRMGVSEDHGNWVSRQAKRRDRPLPEILATGRRLICSYDIGCSGNFIGGPAVVYQNRLKASRETSWTHPLTDRKGGLQPEQLGIWRQLSLFLPRPIKSSGLILFHGQELRLGTFGDITGTTRSGQGGLSDVKMK